MRTRRPGANRRCRPGSGGRRPLDRADGAAPDLIAVITEASLLYRWGGAHQWQAQLDHPAVVSRRPHVDLRILRFRDGLHPGMCGLINIFDLPDGEPPVVYLETDFAVQEVGSQKDIHAYIQTFGRIRAAALDPPATTAYLKQLAHQ